MIRLNIRKKIKEESKMDNKGALVLGTVIGLVLGASVALLLAPQSGKETRKQIKDKVMEAKDFAEEKMVEIKTKAGRVIGVISERYTSDLDEGK
jgi:gas vesicle protein